MHLFFLLLQLSMIVVINFQEIISPAYSFTIINFCGFLFNAAGLISQNQSNMADTVQYGRPLSADSVKYGMFSNSFLIF